MVIYIIVFKKERLDNMKCKKCESTNVNVQTNSFTKTKSRSFLWNLLMVCLTGGIWLLWMLIRKRKEKVIAETWATCQDCGHRWKIK